MTDRDLGFDIDARYREMKDWLLVAITEGRIEMPDAQNRMRAIQAAVAHGIDIPNIQTDTHVEPDHDWLFTPPPMTYVQTDDLFLHAMIREHQGRCETCQKERDRWAREEA